MYGFSDHLKDIPHLVEGAAAGLLAILDSHVGIVEHMFEGIARLTGPLLGEARPLLPARGRRRLDARGRGPRAPGRRRDLRGAREELPGSRGSSSRTSTPTTSAALPRPARRRAPPSSRASSTTSSACTSGKPRLAGGDRRLVPPQRCAGAGGERADRGGLALRAVHPVRRRPQPVGPGDSVDGWDVIATPGHADGHLCLVRDGVLIAGDHVLPTISAVGLYPDSRPDPLADYLRSLEERRPSTSASRSPATASVGDGRRCRELIEHHRRRLDATLRRSATGRGPAMVSLGLFQTRLRRGQALRRGRDALASGTAPR